MTYFSWGPFQEFKSFVLLGNIVLLPVTNQGWRYSPDLVVVPVFIWICKMCILHNRSHSLSFLFIVNHDIIHLLVGLLLYKPPSYHAFCKSCIRRDYLCRLLSCCCFTKIKFMSVCLCAVVIDRGLLVVACDHYFLVGQIFWEKPT